MKGTSVSRKRSVFRLASIAVLGILVFGQIPTHAALTPLAS